jgi:soluble lytic murein transglycosylase
LRFGASYLAQQLERFDGRPLPALAAYNGGPGNASRWLAAADGDSDLFAEVIDFSETRRYVRLVTEHRAQYERLYR